MGLLATTHRKGAGASPLRATLLSLRSTLCRHRLSNCLHAAFGAAYISFAMAIYCHQQGLHATPGRRHAAGLRTQPNGICIVRSVLGAYGLTHRRKVCEQGLQVRRVGCSGAWQTRVQYMCLSDMHYIDCHT
jgi:hypothetical protein